nr:MAG TPA: protein of unknown function (DUF5433) [Caudoviricetes sp.]
MYNSCINKRAVDFSTVLFILVEAVGVFYIDFKKFRLI